MGAQYLNFRPSHAATLDDSTVERCYPRIGYAQQAEHEVSDSQPRASWDKIAHAPGVMVSREEPSVNLNTSIRWITV